MTRYPSNVFKWIKIAGGLGLALAAASGSVKTDRELGLMILRGAKQAVIDEYYDPVRLQQVLEPRFAQAEKELQLAKTNGEIFRVIGQAFVDLGDSHTYFIPPSRAAKVHYGWKFRVVGDACLVHWVDPTSDARQQGLAVGDRIETINGIPANRATADNIKYLFYSLDPQAGLMVSAVSPTGERRQLALKAEVKAGRKVLNLMAGPDRSRIILQGEESEENWASAFGEVNGVLIWRLPDFSRPPSDLDDGFLRLGKAKSLILDLRGNGGGSAETLERLLGKFFDREVVIGEQRERKKTKVRKISPGLRPFGGLVIVLVDADSGSASEILARVLQLEDRGIVIGDRTSGTVQAAHYLRKGAGVNPVVPYGVAVTTSIVIMRDGKSLEKVGVAPDLPSLPTGAQMAAGEDPALAKALAQTGNKLTPAEAGKLLPRDKRYDRID